MKSLLKLTDAQSNEPILVGTESIISVEFVMHHGLGKEVTRIRSRGAMIETMFVTESVEQIYQMYNS